MAMTADSAAGSGSEAERPFEGLDAVVKRRRPRGRRRSSEPAAYGFVAPAVVVCCVLVVFPLVATVYLSFTKWNGIGTPAWVGLKNFRDIFVDPRFVSAVPNSLILVIFFAFIPVCLGLLLASLLSRSGLPGLPVFRVILFLPQVIPLIVIGYAWKWSLAPDGFVNAGLRAVGLESWTRYWLGDAKVALLAIGLIGTWIVTGFCMVLFLSGIARIDSQLFDAAKVDGAGAVQEFLSVTLPGIRGELVVALMITVMGALRSFDIVYVTTAGGPNYATQVPALSVYQFAFQDDQVGRGSAAAVVLAAVILIVSVLLQRIPRSVE